MKNAFTAPRTVGIGIQSFEKIVKEGLFYVDKTFFIHQWYRKKDDITLITRPRRFGKTLAMDMMNCFFSVTYAGRSDLFSGLDIAKDQEMMKLQGTIPTISVSLASVKADTYRGFLKDLASVISKTMTKYSYLLESEAIPEDDKELLRKLRRKNQIPPPVMSGDDHAYLEFIDQIQNSLGWLSEWLFLNYGKKVYIFLDEYDTPIQAAYLNHYYDQAVVILREFLFNSLKGNDYLDRALLSGITRIAKESLFSEMNNVAVYSVVRGGYDTAFGFTRKEIDDIILEYDLEEERETIQYWYDGFCIGKEQEIYNPWSVTNYLANERKLPEDYWAQSGGLGMVDSLVKSGDPVLHEALRRLIYGENFETGLSEDLIYPDLEKDDNAVWSLLVAAGYLKPVGIPPEQEAESGHHLQGLRPYDGAEHRLLALTNYEVKLSFLRMIERWFRHGSTDYMRCFVQALLKCDLEEMNRYMKQIVLLAVSSFDSGIKPSHGSIHPENYFHGLTTGLLVSLMNTYVLTSNRESGFGRYDLCLEPLQGRFEKVYLLELKVYDVTKGDKNLRDTARRALQQIDEKGYDSGLIGRGYRKEQIMKYGFGFKGKEVLIVSC